MSKLNNDDLEAMLDDLRECETELSSGAFDNGKNAFEAEVLESRAKKIQEAIRESFPDVDPRVYRFAPGS